MDPATRTRRRAARRLALANNLGRPGRGPSLWAAEAALEALRVDPVLEGYARGEAARGAEALRLLPASLAEDPLARRALAELAGVVRFLLGDVDLGPRWSIGSV